MEGLLALRSLVGARGGYLASMRGTIQLAKPGHCNNSRKCVFFSGGRRTALEIAITFTFKVGFSGMFFVSCLLVRECRGRDGNFLKKMISVLFIFFLGEIPEWILMAKEWRFLNLWRLKRIFLGPQRSIKWVWVGFLLCYQGHIRRTFLLILLKSL